jgi:hypothetical protein
MQYLSFLGYISLVFWSVIGAIFFFRNLDEFKKTRQRVVAGIIGGPIVWFFCGAFLLGSVWARVFDLMIKLIKKL